MARGSNLEVQTQMVIASELGFGDLAKGKLCNGLSEEVGKMLAALMRSI
jgi:hypothetical protein